MAPPREPGRSRTTIVVLVLISISVIALDAGGFGPVNSVKSGLGTVFSPVRAVGDTVFGPIGDAFNGVFNREDLAAENERLREEVDRLRGEQAQAQEAAAELDEMRQALRLPTYEGITSTHAEVVATGSSNFDRTIQINKGANAGIRRGMPVITAAGLVGRVVEVSLNSAHVQLVTDPEFRVGVKHVISSDIGVAEGRGPDLPLRVAVGLDAATEIHTGDYFTTSGVEHSLFPPGIPVGRATEAVAAAQPAAEGDVTTTTSTTSPARSIEQTIDLAPAADIDHLRFVSVMLWTPGQGP